MAKYERSIGSVQVKYFGNKAREVRLRCSRQYYNISIGLLMLEEQARRQSRRAKNRWMDEVKDWPYCK